MINNILNTLSITFLWMLLWLNQTQDMQQLLCVLGVITGVASVWVTLKKY